MVHRNNVNLRSALLDFLQLGANAFAGGLVAAIALAVIALALSTASQAATPGDAKTGALLFRTEQAGQYVEAPTVRTEVAIEVNGAIARTRLTQVFHNPGAEYVEGLYVFPLPEKGAVDHLWMRIGDRAIEGQIREKGEARKAYEKAKSEGKKAALVEQQRPNLFTNSVAHIGPGEDVRVTLEYQQTLAYDGGEYRLRFPLAVMPRYTPAPSAPDAIPDEPKAVEASADDGPIVHPAYAAAGPGGAVNPVDIVVVIDSGIGLSRLESSYHEIAIEKEGSHRTAVYLQRDLQEADHDFELKWSLAAGAGPQAAMFKETVAGNDYALLMVVPPEPGAADKAAHARVPREVVLIIDTSGSVQGASIAQAKAAVAFALDTLTPNDRFNVIEFNSVMRTLFAQSLPATADRIAEAKSWVAKLRADGGTEMVPPLTFALDGTETPGVLRQVVFMTDGGVSNEEDLFRLIAARLGSTRLFTVGIGSAPNGHFMTRAAELGRGTFTYVGDVREVGEKMTRLFAKIEAPVLQDVQVRWSDGTPLETLPARVPDLYLGEPIMVSARAADFSRTVVVSGMRGNQPWSVALAPAADGNAAGVGALWARAQIAQLGDEITRGASLEEVKPKIVAVALEHHLVSAYTSLVAVDVTPTGPAGGTKSAMVKASLPQGWSATIPQTDTPATLQLLLGMLALSAAAAVAMIGRNAAAPRA